MTTPKPIYTATNCNFAYQLRWGLTIFWQFQIHEQHWYSELVKNLEPQGIRILSWRWKRTSVSQFAVSTLPHVSPATIVQQVRSSLQTQVQAIARSPMRSRFAIRSYGSQERRIIETYVAKQPRHHRVASVATQEMLESLVIENQNIDLSQPRQSMGGHYWYNLHCVFVHRDRSRYCDGEWLLASQNAVVRTCAKKGWLLSRLSLVPDHLHASMGCSISESPADVVLSLMNNVAWIHNMKPVFCHSGYMGTFGEYDQRSIAGSRQGPG